MPTLGSDPARTTLATASASRTRAAASSASGPARSASSIKAFNGASVKTRLQSRSAIDGTWSLPPRWTAGSAVSGRW